MWLLIHYFIRASLSSFRSNKRKILAGMVGWGAISMPIFFCEPALAQVIFRRPVVDSYGNCTWRDNGDGSVTASLIANFRMYTDTSFTGRLYSRTIMPLVYDKDGKVVRGTQAFSPSVIMDGVPSNYSVSVIRPDWPGMIFYRRWSPNENNSWTNIFNFAAYIEVTVRGQWSAISVTAGNFNVGGMGFTEEVTGAAYLYPDSNGSGCQVVDPFHPPKPPVTIRMSAPDWDLGELPMDHGEKRFTAADDQLCFSYSGLSAGGAAVVVDAESQNGVVNDQYQLKALADPNQVIPYTVVLNGGLYDIDLPNRRRLPVVLNASGRTCFTSVFHTYVAPGLKRGDYSDVLTFTVVSMT
ncbi:hypothetical protein [Burkholderia plantarii]|uniref:hypothetical protein n=1 Tax=Burkholderia plantarii TaxID=41899 RepID=UPI0018DB8B6E|nr:hypothetical protein [Burkholderia plantarii]MBI0329656.1 hypothetical protein [Burkholderia plantarii]